MTQDNEAQQALKEKKEREAKQHKADEDQALREKRAAEREVKFTVQQMNGQPLYLCKDGEWRTGEMLREDDE